mmetsp:Transcript_1105/g.2030  ORF Transcript_1105/g.2030 Transcript_1105/m.2030 type:complete len:353 (+) Transcript_1105:35-1093(+)
MIEKSGMDGLGNIRGRFVKEREILKMLDYSKFQQPGLRVTPTDETDELRIKKLDRFEFQENVFLMLTDDSLGDNQDFTVIPVEFKYKFLAGFRQGIGSRFGPSQELAVKYKQLDIQIKQCQILTNPKKPAAADEDDDDDFEEDEGEEDQSSGGSQKKLQTSSIVQLACGMVDLANEEMKKPELWFNIEERFKNKMLDLSNAAKLNVWYSVREIEYSFQLLCSGIELRHPVSGYTQDSVYMRLIMTEEALNIDEYCDNNAQELDKLHPRLIQSKDHEVKMIEERLQGDKELGSRYYWGEIFYEPEWYGRMAAHHEMIILSPILHQLNSHMGYREWCEKAHPDYDVVRCAHAYS